MQITVEQISGASHGRASARPGTRHCIGLFAVAGAAFLATYPVASVAASISLILSLSLVALACLGASNASGVDAVRTLVRRLAPVHAASLLWLAILFGHLLAGAHGPVISGLSAALLFALLMAMDALISAAAIVFWSSVTDSDPATGIALQVADKYAGLVGEID